VVEELHERTAHRLRAVDQRYTANRRAIVELLATTANPVTIQELRRQRHDLAQSSLYRNLAVLQEAGVVNRVLSSDEFARYELAEDLTDHHHHHLICSGCGAVADFTVSSELEHQLGRAVAEAERRSGFHADHHRLDLVGVCAACR
jgi:Fe2+ or Zn2+ uptake regulation protein